MAARSPRSRDRLVDGLLATVPDAFENGDRAAKIAGNAHVGFRGVEAETLLVAARPGRRVRGRGVVVLVGRHRAVARARRRWASTARDALASIRLSLGFASTDADVDVALAVDPARGGAAPQPPAVAA